MKKTKQYLQLKKKHNNCYSAKIKAQDLPYFYEAYFSEHFNTFYSQKEINMCSILKFGSRIPDLIKHHKKPNAECKFEELNLKTLYYKQKISSKKAYCEFSYYNGKLFHFSYCFKYLTENDKAEISTLMARKYMGDDFYYPDFKIVDTQGNFIVIDNSMYLTVCYFENNAELIPRLKRILFNKENTFNQQKTKNNSQLYKIL